MRASHRSVLRRLAPIETERSRLTLLFVGFGAGVALGALQPAPLVTPWAVTAAGFALAAVGGGRRRDRSGSVRLIVAASVALGAAWFTLRERVVDPAAAMTFVGETPVLVRVEGRAASAPTVRRVHGAMSRFDFREPETMFYLDVDRVRTPSGETRRAGGRLLVRVADTMPTIRIGDHIGATGLLQRRASPANPGARRNARPVAGVLRVAARPLVTTSPPPLGRGLRHLRTRLQRRAHAGLLGDGPAPPAERQTLLSALLLGVRDGGAAQASFQRVGVAHVLAISGLHVGVVAGTCVLVLACAGVRGRGRAIGVILIIAAYLLVIETRPPVWRASVMVVVAALGTLTGRRWRAEGLVAASGLALLVWTPTDVFEPGFQLSFGVVLALVRLAAPARARWFATSAASVATAGQMAGHWLATAAAASAVAWLTAAPIALHHFGLVSPLGAPLAIIVLPLVTITLVLGLAKMLLAVALPSAALMVGAALGVTADAILAVVAAADRVPGASCVVAAPSVLWTAAALVWSWRCCARGMSRARWLQLGALMAWLLWPAAPHPWQPALRVDMLSVSDGSCFVVRSGRHTMLFDAGSVSDLDVGRTRIVPALRHLGVRSIDMLVISHADLDHYAAVLDVAEALPVRAVCVTTQLRASARAAPTGPTAFLLDALTQRGLTITDAHAGRHEPLGRATVRWLHPRRDDRFAHDNDASMVIAIEAAGRRVLLTGDLQRGGIERLTRRCPDLRADVVELPHHGAACVATAPLVEQLGPSVIMQSTGWRRWARDTYAGLWPNAERLVTARDGACTVLIERNGRVRTRRYRR